MNIYNNEYSAAILAGGNNTRFNGTNKALLKYNETTFIQKIYNTLSTIFDDIIIISNAPKNIQEKTPYTVFEDKIKFCGPLSGIHAALLYSNTEKVFVVSCDMPFIREDVIKKQIQYFSLFTSKDTCIPKIDNYIEPLHAIYSKKNINMLENFLHTSDNYKILKFLVKTEICYWQINNIKGIKDTFININTPEEYTKFLRKFNDY